MLQIGCYIADKKENDLWMCHNIGIVASVNQSYIIFKSCYDGLYYATPIDRYTIVDKFGFPL